MKVLCLDTIIVKATTPNPGRHTTEPQKPAYPQPPKTPSKSKSQKSLFPGADESQPRGTNRIGKCNETLYLPLKKALPN